MAVCGGKMRTRRVGVQETKMRDAVMGAKMVPRFSRRHTLVVTLMPLCIFVIVALG